MSILREQILWPHSLWVGSNRWKVYRLNVAKVLFQRKTDAVWTRSMRLCCWRVLCGVLFLRCFCGFALGSVNRPVLASWIGCFYFFQEATSRPCLTPSVDHGIFVHWGSLLFWYPSCDCELLSRYTDTDTVCRWKNKQTLSVEVLRSFRVRCLHFGADAMDLSLRAWRKGAGEPFKLENRTTQSARRARNNSVSSSVGCLMDGGLTGNLFLFAPHATINRRHACNCSKPPQHARSLRSDLEKTDLVKFQVHRYWKDTKQPGYDSRATARMTQQPRLHATLASLSPMSPEVPLYHKLYTFISTAASSRSSCGPAAARHKNQTLPQLRFKSSASPILTWNPVLVRRHAQSTTWSLTSSHPPYINTSCPPHTVAPWNRS